MAEDQEEYDFIIIGGGTSGLVVAARLSENPKISVLVLEAGDNNLANHKIRIPGLWESLIGSDLDWSFATTPQTYLDGRVIIYPQGRTLGGTSALNSQVFIAPSEVGIDIWRDLGNPGWDWKTMSHYYEKCCTLAIPHKDICIQLGLEYSTEQGQRGTNGPIKTSYTAVLDNPLGKTWIDTFRALGYRSTGDPFSGSSMGGFSIITTVDGATKERSYSASAYFVPAQHRPNLRLLTGSEVERITFDKAPGLISATGVVVMRSGARQIFRARKEVIVAAGTLNSPKILELSGIGNPDILQSHGVDALIANNSVGENLQDHAMTGISFEVQDHVETLDNLRRGDPQFIQSAMKAYQVDKSGPFSGASVNSYAFMPVVNLPSSDRAVSLGHLLEKHQPSQQSAEYEFVRSILSTTDKSSVLYFIYPAQANFGVETSNVEDPTESLSKRNYVTICALLSYPLSRGSVHIRSASSADKPNIDPQFLSHPLDLEVFARHLRFINTLAATEPLSSLLKPHGRRRPDFATADMGLQDAKDYLRRTATAGWHPVGTCAMRPRGDGGVVNERLIVHGSKNLRVVDASVMPLIPQVNLQSTVYAVAERAADLIKEDHGIV